MLISVLLGTTSMAASSGTVATIGSKKYTSLESAVKAVKSGQTIVLKKNVSYSSAVSISRSGVSFKLNLNEHTITFKGSAALVVKKGTVTISNGTIKTTNQTGYALKVRSGAVVKISSGTYKGQILNEGTMTVTGGTFTSVNKSRDLDTVLNTGLITNKGTMTIKGGTFNGGKNQTILNKGTMKIYDGTFKDSIDFYEYDKIESPEYMNGSLISNQTKKAQITIYGGTFKSNVGCLSNGENAVMYIKDGKFTSQYACVFNNWGKLVIADGTFKIVNGGWGVSYTWNGTTTIKGGTFTSQWTLVETYGEDVVVKITGGTFKTTTSDIAMLLGFNGKITVTDGTFTSKSGYAYYQEGGKVTIKGGTFNTKYDKQESLD